MGKKGTTVYLDAEDDKKLEAIENKTGHKKSSIIRQAVKEFLSKRGVEHE